jgi:hypothetical protein
MAAGTSEESLRRLVDAIVANDGAFFSKLIDGSSALATASFPQGAIRFALMFLRFRVMDVTTR